jgi:DNA polymerase-1
VRTLLIDGDIACYQIASSCEVETDWGDDLWTLHSDLSEAKGQLDVYLADLKEKLGADELIVCLTDGENFRKAILPSYKEHRKKVRKPVCLKELRKYLHESQKVYQRPGLEADDCLGILATKPHEGEYVVVSLDKDLQQIPGLVYRPGTDQEPQLIDEHEADYHHMFQTLVGDKTDGYAGCPGIGPVKAEKILNEAAEEWLDASTRSSPGPEILPFRWRAVVEAYAKAGLGEAEALRQAQVARILRASDYDFVNKKPIPWRPK